MCAVHSGCSACVSFLFKSANTVLRSPTICASVLMFLFTSAASTSICKILAFDANFEGLPITRSENLAPNAIKRSHSDTPRFDVFVPCIPIIPVYKSSLPLNPPLPIKESQTGESIFLANSFTSSYAPDKIAPPPR